MKKIGIFSGYYLPHLGGVERYVDKLAGALEDLGYEVVIVTSKHDDDLKGYETISGRAVYRLPTYGIAKNRYPIPRRNMEYKQLLTNIRAENIDYFIVNTRFHLTSLVGAKIGRSASSPVMLIEHGTNHFTVGNKVIDFFGAIYEHLLTWVLKRYVDKYYGVSKKCNVWLKHFSILASGTFYNAINKADGRNHKDFYGSKYKSDQIVVVYAGRLIKEKGVLNLIDAFKLVRSSNADLKLKLVIAGDGDLLKTIQAEYQDGDIDILGKLDFAHVMALFKRADIFAHPSLYPEGLPTVILEAGLMGCAVVATPRGGTDEVISDERYGIIVDGSAEELAAAIKRLAASQTTRRALSEALKRRVENSFNWAMVAKAVDDEIKMFKTV